MSHRVHPIPAIIDLPLNEIVDQRRIARIASGAALAAAVHAGLHLPVV
jgi:glycerol-1-phosphate dehydrogenase [NAD(P)+]